MPTARINEDTVQWSHPTQDILQRLATAPLLLLLHGYASDEHDLIRLAPHLPGTVVCASPRAPLHTQPGIGGYQWYEHSLSMPAPEAATASTAAVLSWLDQLEGRVVGGFRHVAVLGFSQGGAMAIELMRAAPHRFTAIVNCAGYAISGTRSGDAALATQPIPTLWVRDTADPVITPEKIANTSAWLPQHSQLTELHYPNTGHSISPQAISDINTFLTNQLRVNA